MAQQTARREAKWKMRKVGWWTLALVAWSLCGCDAQPTGEPLAGSARPTSVSRSATPEAASRVERRQDTITIASFNIQVFGQSKADKPEVMDVLAEVARRFDVLAIQEIRSKSQDIMPRFIERINANGSRYGFVIGPRLGRTSSKEQYAFVYDTTRLDLVSGSVYTVPDPQDYLHRPPLVARFRTRVAEERPAFSFTLVNIHTDPDETDLELDSLDDVFVSVTRDGSGEDDVILLGDLNVDHRNLGELGQLPGITYTVAGEKTNTRLTKSYDNLVFDGRQTVEYTGRGGVLNLMSEFGLTEEQALEVSDHLPVWGEFSIHESQGAFMARQPGSSRY